MADVILSGFVRTGAGVAVNAATVDAFDRNTTTPNRGTTTTNASGYWTLTIATQGRYDIRVTNGSSISFMSYDDEIQVDQIETATLRMLNPAFTFVYTITPGAITADRTLNLPVLTAADTVAVLALAQTFITGVKTFNSSILAIRNPADTFSYTIVGSAITAARNITIPLLTAADTFAVLGLAQTFSALQTFNANIAFPATQVSDAGANVFDDYEEGTWTMALQFGGAAVGLTTNDNVGTYTKAGRVVMLTGYLALSAKGTSVGAAQITGLPFAAGAGNTFENAVSILLDAVSFADTPSGRVGGGGSAVVLNETTNAGALSSLADTDFVNASTVRVGGNYNT